MSGYFYKRNLNAMQKVPVCQCVEGIPLLDVRQQVRRCLAISGWWSITAQLAALNEGYSLDDDDEGPSIRIGADVN
jgi:hypothetical protein